MSNLCIITARGGSKRIPNKNIKDFCGKPIIAYSIMAALESGIFSEVMVSTDSQAIAKVAKDFGASVPFMRSAKNSDDFASTADVLLEDLDEYQKRGFCPQDFACIYPTAPFITAKKLQKAYEILKNQNADLVVSVCKFSFPPQRAYCVKDGFLAYKEPQNAPKRSQDLEPLYHDGGQFYFYNTERFLSLNGCITEKIVPFELSELETQDIDNQSDWELAALKFKLMQSQNQ